MACVSCNGFGSIDCDCGDLDTDYEGHIERPYKSLAEACEDFGSRAAYGLFEDDDTIEAFLLEVLG
jgi:hypothetical protein